MTNIIKRYARPLFVSDLQDEINRLFDFALPTTREKSLSDVMGDFTPAIDIKDEKDHYLIKVDVPGVDPKNIEITMNDGVLTIKGEKEIEKEDKTDNYIRVERSKGIFYRNLKLPETVDAEKITAKSKNGVLQIVVPKSKKESARKITVES